jgi:MFS family permease
MSGELPRRAVAAIALAAVVPPHDSTISVVAVPTQSRMFEASFAVEQWMLNMAPLLLTILLVPAGLAGDQFGCRRLLRIGLAAVCAGALVTAIAPGVIVLLAGRALTGAGSACLLPATMALIRQHSPRSPARTRRFGLLAGWAGFAAALGPLVGGLLVDHASWRWVYAVPALLAALSWIGTKAIADDGARMGARSALSEAARAVGRGEVSRNCVAGNAITFALYFGLFGVSYLIVAGGQASLHWSATAAALSLVPMSIALWVGAERLGVLVHRIGTRALIATAVIGGAAALAWTGYGIIDGGSWWHIMPGTVLFGVAVAAAAAPLTHAAVTSLPGTLSGVGAAVHHAVVRASALAATLGLGALAADERAIASPEGLWRGLLASAVLVCAAGLPAVALLDDRRPGSVPPADEASASSDPSSAAHSVVGHQASTS